MGKVCLFDKGLRTELVTTSTLISDKPCFLYSILISGFTYIYPYIVSGSALPSPSGNYLYGGEYNGFPYYYRTDYSYYILAGPSYTYYIANKPPDIYPTILWGNGISSPMGDYGPIRGCSFIATVSAGVLTYVNIYNGFDIKGVKLLYFIGNLTAYYSLIYKYPILFTKGFFIDIIYSGVSCLIGYKVLI
jgi:hypothetical protein